MCNCILKHCNWNQFRNSEIVIRLGELHVVFTAFKMVGKIIDGSGLDKAFEEALIYGSNTVKQIKDGHHLYSVLRVTKSYLYRCSKNI